jgi:hypothetical protein
MKIICPSCKRLQEVTDEAWKITQEGLPTGLPAPLDMMGVHPFTCTCGALMLPACLICGIPTTNGFQLSGHGWFCSPNCYGIFIKERQKRIAKDIYGDKAIG